MCIRDRVEYAGNASAEPEINGRVLTWHIGTLFVNHTESISFDVKAKAKGVIPINTKNSTLTYEDFYGMIKEVEVPVVYVNVLNRAPVIERIGWSVNTTCIYHNDTEKKYVFMANESEGLNERGTVVKLAIAARDPDCDPLSYSKDSNIGTLETNDFYWSPGYDFVRHPERRKNVTITFTVSDGELSDNATVIIIVNDVNRPPILDKIGDKIVNEGKTLNIVLNATDPDGDELNFSSSVEFGSFDENIWRWTPDYDDAGVYYVKFTVSDRIGGIDNETVRITVEDSIYVRDVVWEGIRPVTIGSPLTITATAKIKNKLDENVSVTAELLVDDICLNKNKATIKRKQNGTISVSAIWIPMSSGMHDISLHIYNESYWVSNKSTKKVEVFIEKVELTE